jgi:hypothetical protein
MRGRDELFLQRREEALCDGVVEAVTARAHRLGDAGGAGLLTEGQRDELAALVGMPDQPGAGRRRASAICRASVTSSARMWSAIDQPTIRREKTSWTATRYSQPSHVRR